MIPSSTWTKHLYCFYVITLKFYYNISFILQTVRQFVILNYSTIMYCYIDVYIYIYIYIYISVIGLITLISGIFSVKLC